MFEPQARDIDDESPKSDVQKNLINDFNSVCDPAIRPQERLTPFQDLRGDNVYALKNEVLFNHLEPKRRPPVDPATIYSNVDRLC